MMDAATLLVAARDGAKEEVMVDIRDDVTDPTSDAPPPVIVVASSPAFRTARLRNTAMTTSVATRTVMMPNAMCRGMFFCCCCCCCR